MGDLFLQRMRIYLHLVPVFGIIPSLWTLYKSEPRHKSEPSRSSRSTHRNDAYETKAYGVSCVSIEDMSSAQLKAASQLSVLIGLSSISAIALFGAAASSQATQLATLRLLIGSSFIGSGYFLLSLALMFRVAKGRSIRIRGLTALSQRLP